MAKQREVNSESDVFPAGSLWDRVQQTAARARQSGALKPIDTRATHSSERGIQFLVRVVSRLRDKPTSNEEHNPFLPYEKALYVAHALTSHLCVLNKYNVVDHHLLIVTREFEHQQSTLTRQDFHALWRCLHEYDSLGFYNSGAPSGASQRHKHLQLIPFPTDWTADKHRVTLCSKLSATTSPPREVSQVDGLPFQHAFVRRDIPDASDLVDTAAETLALYHEMLHFVGITEPKTSRGLVSVPYNLLVSRQWMFLIPRSRECFRDISLNALAFVGAFLVQDRGQLEELLQAGPLTALQTVTFPRTEPPASHDQSAIHRI